MKRIAIISCLAAVGCASHQPQKPTGEYKWRNDQLYAQRDSGEITSKDVEYKFVVTKNTCKIDALKVPVPSPSCTQPPRQDCTGMTGFARGFCQSYIPRPQCDYSSVNAAYSAQEEIFDSCMGLSGWQKVWEPYVQQAETSPTLPAISTETPNVIEANTSEKKESHSSTTSQVVMPVSTKTHE